MPVVQRAADPAPAAQPVYVTPPQKITLASDALFDFDSAVIKTDGKLHLDALVPKIRALDTETVLVLGHTNSVGTNDYNKRLSTRRAVAVKAYLVVQGVMPSNILSEGRGETEPVATNKTEAGRAMNRRVEITVAGTSENT